MATIVGWKSKALWTKFGISEDTHSERAQAFNAAHMLRRDYSVKPCEFRGLCVDTWFEPILVDEDAPQDEERTTSTNTQSA